jgi:hypothetical protein
VANSSALAAFWCRFKAGTASGISKNKQEIFRFQPNVIFRGAMRNDVQGLPFIHIFAPSKYKGEQQTLGTAIPPFIG